MDYCKADIESILLTSGQISERLDELAHDISRDYNDKNPLVICILKGSVVFYGDLIRRLNCPIEMDFISVSSYGLSDRSSGAVKIKKDTDNCIAGRHVLIVEDIVDSGITISSLLELLKKRDPLSLKLVSLLDKPARRERDVSPDYTGFIIPDGFIVGYGLDYAERYRNLPYLGILSPAVYMKNK